MTSVGTVSDKPQETLAEQNDVADKKELAKLLATLQATKDPSTTDSQAITMLQQWQSSLASGTPDVTSDFLLAQINTALQNQDGSLSASSIDQTSFNDLHNAYMTLEQGPQTAQVVSYEKTLTSAWNSLKAAPSANALKADATAATIQKSLVGMNTYVAGLGLGSTAGQLDPGGSISQQIKNLEDALASVTTPTDSDKQAQAALSALKSAWGSGSNDASVQKSAEQLLGQIRVSVQRQSSGVDPTAQDKTSLTDLQNAYAVLEQGPQTAQAVSLEATLVADAKTLQADPSANFLAADTMQASILKDYNKVASYLSGLGLGNNAGSATVSGSLSDQITALQNALNSVATPTNADKQALAGLASLKKALSSSEQTDSVKTYEAQILNQIRAGVQQQSTSLDPSQVDKNVMTNLQNEYMELTQGVQTSGVVAQEQKLAADYQTLYNKQDTDLVSADNNAVTMGQDVTDSEATLEKLGLGSNAGSTNPGGSIADQISALEDALHTVSNLTGTDKQAEAALEDLKNAWDSSKQSTDDSTSAEGVLNQIRSALQNQDSSIDPATIASNMYGDLDMELQGLELANQTSQAKQYEQDLVADMNTLKNSPPTDLLTANSENAQVQQEISTINAYLNQLGSYS